MNNENLAAPITPQEIQQATAALVQATEQQAVQAGTDAELRAAQLAPGLATASNAPGGYNYGRFIAPTTPVLTSGLVTAAQQNVLRNALREAQYAASQEYEDAQFAYRDRQRAYQAEQAARNRRRRQQAERQAAADRLAAIRAANNTPIATNNSSAQVVARPTQSLQVTPAPVTNPLQVVQGSGLQNWGGIGNNAVLRVR